MRLACTALVFLASLTAAVLVHAARADAAWAPPQSVDSGLEPHVRISGDAMFVGYAKPPAHDARELLVTAGNEPTVRVKVPRAGRVVAFDIDAQGRLVALREAKRDRRSPRRVLAYAAGRWRPISSARSSAVDAKLAVAGSGAAVAAWLQYEGRRVFVHAAVRAPGARRFGAARRISGATSRSAQTLAVAVGDDGSPVVAFTERRDLWMWRSGGDAVRIHDATDVTAGAFAVAAAARGPIGLVAFTRLEDREPPEYRAVAALRIAGEAPMVETIARNVSALDVAATVDEMALPTVVTSRIGPPYALDVQRYAGGWGVSQSIPAQEPPSELHLVPGAIAWSELTAVHVALGSETAATKLAGRGYNPAVAVAGDRAVAAWDQGGTQPLRVSTFTP